MRFRLSSTLKRPKTLMKATVYDAFFVTVSKRLRFHLSTLQAGRFSKCVLNKLHGFENDFRNRFQMPLFSSAVLGVVVLTIRENASKSMRFRTKTRKYGRALKRKAGGFNKSSSGMKSVFVTD